MSGQGISARMPGCSVKELSSTRAYRMRFIRHLQGKVEATHGQTGLQAV